jgi:hypothetical protein
VPISTLTPLAPATLGNTAHVNGIVGF